MNSLGNCSIIDLFKQKKNILSFELEFNLLVSIVVLKLFSNDSFKNELLTFLYIGFYVFLSYLGVNPAISIETFSFL